MLTYSSDARDIAKGNCLLLADEFIAQDVDMKLLLNEDHVNNYQLRGYNLMVSS